MLIVDVNAIPIIQRYPNECRIKTRLSGQASVTFQSIIRETAMNFGNKTKTLPESAFCFLRKRKFSYLVVNAAEPGKSYGVYVVVVVCYGWLDDICCHLSAK